jgi:hypothetical protein
MQKPVTVTEIFVGEAEFFGTKEECDVVRLGSVRLQSLPDEAAASLQRLQQMPHIAVTYSGSSYN